ncbi:MAG: NFACT family protein [Candidatus Micrarchaeota archaeon]|nr:NFACT family protein [Candidatus Micrarchaeota archaeon]
MKPLSMWEYSFVLEEAADKIVGSYLKKIYQINQTKFSFDFGKFSLIVNLGKNFYLTSNPPAAPKEPSSFVMLLRKHLKGKKLEKFYQACSDRYYRLDFSHSYSLILKQFAKGNLILLQNGKIVLFFYKEEGLEKEKELYFEPSKEIQPDIFIGKKYSFLEPQKAINQKIKEFFVYKDEVYVLPEPNFDTAKAKTFSTLSEAVEFLELEQQQLSQQKEQKNLQELKKLKNRLFFQEQSLAQTEKKIQNLKKSIDYIKNNIQLIQEKLMQNKNSKKITITIN